MDINNIADISEPADEIAFWMRIADDRRSPYKSLAKRYIEGFL
jgi:hypothetical protein